MGVLLANSPYLCGKRFTTTSRKISRQTFCHNTNRQLLPPPLQFVSFHSLSLSVSETDRGNNLKAARKFCLSSLNSYMAFASYNTGVLIKPCPGYKSLSRRWGLAVSTFRYPIRFRATSALTIQQDSNTRQDSTSEIDIFSCPVCYEPLIRKGPPGLTLPAVYRSAFKCQKCNKSFSSREVYLDLTVTSGTKDYTEFYPTKTELFRSPLVSFLYERGWRQNFNRSGFPGPDEEFKMAQEFFKPAEGGLLVDVSCGSGLFSRKFAKSGTYSAVVALDFSENMLRQCYDLVKKDETLVNVNLALVRADVSRLPFSSGSVDAVHAGAALHCWPSPSNAVAEISRILRSGGVFVGSTFLANAFGNSVPSQILRPLRQNLGLTNNIYNSLTEEEIKDLFTSCGLINFSSNVQSYFIMFSAQKP